MSRQVWLVLVGLGMGVGLVSLLSLDPGYVLVQFGPYRLETTLVATGILLLLLGAIMRVIYRLLAAVFGFGPGLSRWLEKRKEERESALLRETLTDVFHDRDSALKQRVTTLEKMPWLSDATKITARQWVFRRQLETASRRDELTRLWRKANKTQQQDADLTSIYASQLSRFGAGKEAEGELLRLSQTAWPPLATNVLATLTLRDAPALVASLTRLSESDASSDAATGLIIAKAQTLPKDEGVTLLQAHYAAHPLSAIKTALGALLIEAD